MTRTRALPFKCSAVITDVDGTLVNDEKRLTWRATSAVAELRASGIIFSIISSRPPRGLRLLLGPLAITTPIGSFNGGVIAAPDLSIITEHLLPPAVARRSVDMLNAHGVQVWVFSGQDWLVRDPDGPYVGLEERTVGFRAKIVKDFEASLDGAAKIVGVSRDFELLARCESDMRAALADQCFGRTFAALLPRHHPSARQQRRRIVGDREAVGRSAGGDRRYRRWRQRCRDVRAERSQHCHGQCQPAGAAGRGFRDGQQSRRRLRQRGRAVHSRRWSFERKRAEATRAGGRA